MFSRFSDLLSIGLSQTAAKITGHIKAELQTLGSHIEIIESHLDTTITRTNQNTDRIQDLQDKLETAISKIDNIKNRSCRYNFRIRGLAKTVTDVHAAVGVGQSS